LPRFFRLLDPGLDLTHTRQVLVELVPVAGVESAAHSAHVLKDEIEDGPLLILPALQALRALPRRSAAEEPFENEARVAFRGKRRRGSAPGEVELVRAGVAESHAPERRTLSQVSSSEGKRVCSPIARARTWSIDTPARMSVALFLTRTPVKKVPFARAWSPAPSGPGVALT
jgi:hypothetical protein